jgi:type I restriction enzyme S subunit
VSEFPPGWIDAQLGDLGAWGSGGTPKRTNASYYADGTIPWLVIGDLNDGVVRNAATKITEEGLANSSAKRLPINTLLVGMYGSIGKLGITGIECATNQAIAHCRPNAATNLLYLFYALKHAKRDLVAQGQGGAQQNISQTLLRAHRVLVPPLGEQKRISAKLNALLARVDACRERLNRVPQLLKRFREAVLEAAVSGRLTEEWREEPQDDAVKLSADSPITLPTSWRWLESQDAVEPTAPIIYGILQPGPDVRGGVPYIQGVDVSDSKILISSLKRTTQAIAVSYSRSTLAPGDVVLCIIRNIKVAIVPPELAGANLSRTMARLRPSHAIRSKYLALALESPYAFRWFQQFFRGIDMPGLNLRDVRRLPIPLPTLEEQDEIIRRVDELFVLADRLGRRYRDVMTRIVKLTPSILSKAFRGELVPQDPNDEPAGRLLERVRGTSGLSRDDQEQAQRGNRTRNVSSRQPAQKRGVGSKRATCAPR